MMTLLFVGQTYNLTVEETLLLCNGTLDVSGDLTLSGFSDMTLHATGLMTVEGDLTIGTNAYFDIYALSGSTGSLIVDGTATGSALAESYIPGTLVDLWQIVTPRVSGQLVSDFVSITYPGNSIIVSGSNNYGIGYYDEANDKWDYYTFPTPAGNLTTGVGYALYQSSGSIVNYVGTILTGNQAISTNRSSDGWNGLGNPYTCAIEATGSGTSFLILVQLRLQEVERVFFQPTAHKWILPMQLFIIGLQTLGYHLPVQVEPSIFNPDRDF